MRRPLLFIAGAAAATLLSACETTNSDNWTGGTATPFNHAERSCGSLTDDISKDENRRDFFIGCMQALGWTPKPGASIEI